ncbi:hypothetical protein B0H10DRAFT_1956614 [Mycena sp. CBHHK59/15]|nr:hypothetical protein B0H10DRAFT_1956614 [Mycena sp. CBHHK59/15]
MKSGVEWADMKSRPAADMKSGCLCACWSWVWVVAGVEVGERKELHVGDHGSVVTKKPHPHSVDLLRNRSPVSPLGPFDGTVAAHAQIGAQHFYITTNTDYVPAVPSLEIPHKVFLRTDMRYGTDDPTLWPQQFTAFYCHLPLISRQGARPELDIMWWNPGPQDFHVGSALMRGLRRLALKRFSPFLPPVTDIVVRCRELRRKSPALAIPLFSQLIQQLLMLLEQLQTLPTTYTKMLFTVTSLQHAFLELDALYIYMTVYKERIDNYLAAPADVTRPGQFVGAFTAVPSVAQQLFGAGIPFWFIRGYEVFDQENILSVVPLMQPNFDLPDPDAHAEGAPPALYTGNSTSEKIAAIQRAAHQTPWYTDPFELKLTRTSDAAPRTTLVHGTASTSRSVAPPLAASSGSAGVQSNQQPKSRYKPYPPKALTPKNPTAKAEHDKFAVLTVPGMPLCIASMADALARVDRSVTPYSSDGADRRYVFPEPTLLVNSSEDRCRKFLHHWRLLADGFIYGLTQNQPQLLSAQEWRDILEGLLTQCGAANSRTQRRSSSLQDRIRPVLDASNVTSIVGFPVPLQDLPHFSLEQTREIVWQVAETGFRFEFCALDRCASGQVRFDQARDCFAGHMLVGVPLTMSKQGWAAAALEERHRYVGRTACLMLNWTTKSARPDIIRRVKASSEWSPADMERLEAAVCQYYTQAFWEYFGRAAVLPMRLDHELEKEDGEI